jgi:hypothetical protein
VTYDWERSWPIGILGLGSNMLSWPTRRIRGPRRDGLPSALLLFVVVAARASCCFSKSLNRLLRAVSFARCFSRAVASARFRARSRGER